MDTLSTSAIPAGIAGNFAKTDCQPDNVKNVRNNVNDAMPTSENHLPDFLSAEETALLKRTILKQFPEDEQESFVRICQRTRLDPFVKQIYATKRYQKLRDGDGNVKKVPTLVPVTGIMGLCAVADRTGQYEGCEISWSGPDGNWMTEWLSDEYPAAAKCVVHRKGRQHPEVAIARWFSYVGQSWDADKRQWVTGEFWDKMPDYMLAKCAKAAALRGAFPDPLSNVFIREELDSNISDAETEAIPADEAKIAENQRRDEEIKKSPPPGVTIVQGTGTGKKPTPAEALEPGLEQDKIPAKPKPKPTSAPTKPVPVPISKVAPETIDDLDMGAPGSAPGAAEQEPTAQPPSDDEEAAAAAVPESAAPWRDHIIMGVQHVKFFKRKVGELNAVELGIIENQWLPTVRQQWDDATEAQRADAAAFEAAIAYGKMAKPW